MNNSEDSTRYSKLKAKNTLPLKVEDQIDYMERVVKNEQSKEKGSFLTCYSAKKNTVDPEFIRAFESLNRDQQSGLFALYVDYIEQYYNKKPLKLENELNDKYIFSVLVREGTLRKSWTVHKVEIDSKTLKVSMVGNDRFHIDLHEYLIRKSKSTDKPCFVLESSKKNIRKTMRIGFDTQDQYNECYRVVSTLIKKAQIQNLDYFMRTYEELKKNLDMNNGKEGNHSNYIKKVGKSQGKKMQLDETKNAENNLYQVPQQIEGPENTIVGELIMEKEEKIDIIDRIVDENNLIQTLHESRLEEQKTGQRPPEHIQVLLKKQASKIEQKKCLDIFHKMLPDYQLDDLQNEDRFKMLKGVGRFRILHHIAKANQYKVCGIVAFQLRRVLAVLLDNSKYKLWNDQVELGDTKIRIASQNSAIIYQKHKPYSKFYKARDYLYLRHVFVQADTHYIIDKSIENSHYPPFSNIIRGTIKYCLWSLHAKGNETMLSIVIELVHEGFLTLEQQEALTVKYLTGMTNLDQYMKQITKTNIQIDKCYDLNWDINKNASNANERRRSASRASRRSEKSLFDNDLSEIDSERLYTARGINDEKWDGVSVLSFEEMDDDNQSEPGVIKQEVKQISQPSVEDPNVDHLINCELNAEGYAILPKTYLSRKQKFMPVQSDYKSIAKPQFQHHIWRDQWKPSPDVGLYYIHQKKIEVQKGVLKYVISKLGSNLLSGKGILSISLPVDIFGTESNLQRTARLMSYGPKFLQKACITKDVVERFKHVMCFGLGCGLMGLEMDKPFNPILGETYQGWMNGCPVFLEQISHHPPIAAFFLQGRGYKVYGSIQSRMEISINSGCGINFGQYIVEFEDNHQRIRFRTPGGEVSGLTFGDRIFNFVGKGLYYDYQNQIFAELIYNPSKKGFFSIGKQEKEADYVAGKIMKVRSDFLEQFKKSNSKKDAPAPKQIIQVLCSIDGRWTQGLKFDGTQYINVSKDVPCILEQEKYPLNSNCHYREDIIYMKKKDIARSQIQKERLENFQRTDRKLREKFHKKRH